MSIVFPGIRVDTEIYGDALPLRRNVMYATTADLAATYNDGAEPANFTGAPANVDSTAVAAGDRILVKNQADAKENGIYVVQAAPTTTWHRAEDYDTGLIVSGTIITATNGVINNGVMHLCTSDSSVSVVGTHDLTYDSYILANAAQTMTNKTMAETSMIGELKMGDNNISGVGPVLSFTDTGDIKVPNGESLTLTHASTNVVTINSDGMTMGDELKMGTNNIIDVGPSLDFAGAGDISVASGNLTLTNDSNTIATISDTDMTMGGDIKMDGNNIDMGTTGPGTGTISNLADPVLGTDAANKNYVDALAQGLSVKASARLGTTGDLGATYLPGGGSGTGSFTGAPTTIDGVSIAEGDRILVKDQEVNEVTTLIAVDQLSLNDNEYFTVFDTLGQYNFVFDYDPLGFTPSGAGGTDVAVVLPGSGATAQQVSDAIVSAINGAAIQVTADNTAGASTTVVITGDNTGSAFGEPVDNTTGTVLTLAVDTDPSDGSIENGLYEVTATTTIWNRTDDFDENEEVISAAFIFVEEGTVNDNNGFTLATNNDIIINTTPLRWVQFSGAGAISAGFGLEQSGSIFSVDLKAAGAGEGGLIANGNEIELNLVTNGGLELTASGLQLDLKAAGAGEGGLVLDGNEVELNLVSNGGLELTASGLQLNLDATNISGTLSVEDGGVGISSYDIGDMLYADGATSLAKLPAVASGSVLSSAGLTTAPVWKSLSSIGANIMIQPNQISVNSTSESDIAFFTWNDTLYGDFEDGTLFCYLGSVGGGGSGRDATVEVFDVVNNALLGSATATSNGILSIPLTSNGGTSGIPGQTYLAIRVKKSASGGVNPQIFGIQIVF